MDLYLKGDKKIKRRSGCFLLSISIFLLLFSLSFFAYTKNPLFFQGASQLERDQEISPHDQIVVRFSRPILWNFLKSKLEISPDDGFNYQWENYNRKLVITPKDHWAIEKQYQISLSGKNIFFFPSNEKYYFRTISYPKITNFYPAYGAKDVALDIEDPIKASFDSSLEDFKVKFVISPFKDVDYNLDTEKNQIDLMPKEELEKGRRYDIGIYIKQKDEGENEYKKISDTFFETKAEIPVNTVWDKDFGIRLEQAKKFTSCQIAEGKYIDINVKSQVMTIFENGTLLDAFMISSGKRGMETPAGTYHIANKTPRAWSKEYGLFMPYWQALVPSGKFGIHELPEWPGGYKEGANHLGTPVSHGCVRLGIGPAKRVYDWTEIGTPVVVHS